MKAVQPLIAIVDDEPSIRLALSRLLRSIGYCVKPFASGVEFLKFLEIKKPDCLLLDLHLPGLTGLDILKFLAQSQIQLRTIVITGHDEPGLSERVLAYGAAVYLPKPLDEKKLLDALALPINAEDV